MGRSGTNSYGKVVRHAHRQHGKAFFANLLLPALEKLAGFGKDRKGLFFIFKKGRHTHIAAQTQMGAVLLHKAQSRLLFFEKKAVLAGFTGNIKLQKNILKTVFFFRLPSPGLAAGSAYAQNE